jgi:hypothetical protein
VLTRTASITDGHRGDEEHEEVEGDEEGVFVVVFDVFVRFVERGEA